VDDYPLRIFTIKTRSVFLEKPLSAEPKARLVGDGVGERPLRMKAHKLDTLGLELVGKSILPTV